MRLVEILIPKQKRDTVEEMLEEEVESPQYAELSLIDVAVEYDDPVPIRQPERVVVRVSIRSAPSRRGSATRSGLERVSAPNRRFDGRLDRSSSLSAPR